MKDIRKDLEIILLPTGEGNIDYADLTSRIYENLSASQRLVNPNYELSLNPETGMFLIEESLKNNIIETCKNNDYTESDLAKIKFALALALYAHKDQYRESGPPYSTHFLGIASELADEDLDAVDCETVVSAILHDTIEDTFLTFENLQFLFGNNIANTVSSLTNYEGDIIRKSIIDEQERIRIIESLIDNPNVARIKIKDKKFNLREIDVKSRSKRIRSINEREEVFIPLAQIIGARNDAEEMMKLCLEKRGRRTRQYLRQREPLLQEYSSEDFKLRLKGNISQVIQPQIDNSEVSDVIVNTPSYKDIYTFGEFRPSIDIVINSNADDDWVHKSVAVLVKIMQSQNIDPLEVFDLEKTLTEIIEGDRNHLSLQVKVNSNTDTHVSINIFPSDTYTWQNSSIKDVNLPISSIDGNLIKRRTAAINKQNILAKRLSATIDSGVKSSSILKEIEPNIPPGYIAITGIDDQGAKEKWRVLEGSSAIALAYDISPSYWPHAHSVTINGRFNELTKSLKPGDEVHISFNDKSHWDPTWVFGFPEGSKGRNAVKRNISRIERAESTLPHQEMRRKILNLGLSRIESHLNENDRPLWVGPNKILVFIHEIYRKGISEDDFLLEVGRGNVSELVMAKVAEKLKPINESVIHIHMVFNTNTSGQIDAVTDILAEQLGINLIGVIAKNISESDSEINIYLDPDDKEKAAEVQKLLNANKRLKLLGLTSIQNIEKT